MKHKFLRYSLLSMLVMLCGGGIFAIGQAISNAQTDKTGTIVFGNNGVKINATSVTGDDDLGNTWTITTVAKESSFTQQSGYSQVGAAKKPATSITFTTTLPNSVSFSSFSAKFGGFANTAGNITLKIGETTVGTGTLSGTDDVEVGGAFNAAVEGNVLTVTVTDIDKGVKCYQISYTYEDTDTREATFVDISNPVITATVGENYYLPTATVRTADGAPVDNSYVIWSSSDEEVAQVASTYHGLIINKTGTATITATYEGADSYKPSKASYTLTVTTAAQEVANVGSLNALEDNTPFKFTGEPLIVAKPTAKHVYIQDDTGSCLLYDKDGTKFGAASVGKTLAANWTGKVSIYRKLFEAVPDAEISVVNADPVEVVYPEVSLDYISADHINEVVMLTGVHYAPGTTNKNYTIYENADATVNGYNQFDLEIAAPEEDATYTMVGAISCYNDNIQFQPISIKKEGAPIDEEILLWQCGDAPAPINWWTDQALIRSGMIKEFVEVGDIINLYMTSISEDASEKNWSYMVCLAGTDYIQISRFTTLSEHPTHVQQYYVSGDLLEMMSTRGLMPWGCGYAIEKITVTKKHSPYSQMMNTVWVGGDDPKKAYVDMIQFKNVNNQRGTHGSDKIYVKTKGTVTPTAMISTQELGLGECEEIGLWMAELTTQQAISLKNSYLEVTSDADIEYVAVEAGDFIDEPIYYNFQWKNNGKLETTVGADPISFADLFTITDANTGKDITDEALGALRPLWLLISDASVLGWDEANKQLLIVGPGEATITACCSSNDLYKFNGDSGYAEYEMTVMVTDSSTSEEEDEDVFNFSDFRKWRWEQMYDQTKWRVIDIKEHYIDRRFIPERKVLRNRVKFTRQPLGLSSGTGNSPARRAAEDDELSMDDLLFTAEPDGIEANMTEGGVILKGSMDIPNVKPGDKVRVYTKNENDGTYGMHEETLTEEDIYDDGNGKHFYKYDAIDKSGLIVYIEIIHESATGIEVIEVLPLFNEAEPMYNLKGQRVTKDYRGVIIQNGKKINNK